MSSQCEVDACERPISAVNMCDTHRRQFRKNGTTGEIGRGGRKFHAKRPDCAVSHCSRESISASGLGFCKGHYAISARGFDPEMKPLDPPEVRPDCAVADCQRRPGGDGICDYHRSKIRIGTLVAPEGVDIVLNPPCSFSGCKNLARSMRGVQLCGPHARMQNSGKDLRPLVDGAMARGEMACLVDNCPNPALTLKMCKSHASRHRAYGLSIEDLSVIHRIHECENPGCSNRNSLCVDHDHQTGAVRGVLCSGCNTSLGLLGESLERLEGLRAYIQKVSQNAITS